MGLELLEWERRRGAIVPTRHIAALAQPTCCSARGPGHGEPPCTPRDGSTPNAGIWSTAPCRPESPKSASGLVLAGGLLVPLCSPDVRIHVMPYAMSVVAFALQLDRTVGRADGLECYATIAERLTGTVADVDAGRGSLQRLVPRAPFDGVLGERDPQVRPGDWVDATRPIAMLYALQAWVVNVLVAHARSVASRSARQRASSAETTCRCH